MLSIIVFSLKNKNHYLGKHYRHGNHAFWRCLKMAKFERLLSNQLNVNKLSML